VKPNRSGWRLWKRSPVKVPVIATRVGGLVEVVIDGENGYLVEVGDIASMSARAVELLEDGARRAKMGRHGRSWAVEHFNTERVIPQYIDLYQRVLTKQAVSV
jgi:glycosyltransferase involved in cell wall biosynthesis